MFWDVLGILESEKSECSRFNANKIVAGEKKEGPSPLKQRIMTGSAPFSHL